MRIRLSASASALCLGFVIALAASQSAAASPFALIYQGVTTTSSINGNPIADGTSFTIQIGFDSSSEDPGEQGVAEYEPTSISLEIVGTPFTVTSLSGDAIVLADASNQIFPSVNIPIFGSGLDNTEFLPGYLGTSTLGWSATDVTPTVFDDYIGSQFEELDLPTTAGQLDLNYDAVGGVNASIIATPEGNTFAFLLLGMAALGLGTAIRRSGFAAH